MAMWVPGALRLQGCAIASDFGPLWKWAISELLMRLIRVIRGPSKAGLTGSGATVRLILPARADARSQ